MNWRREFAYSAVVLIIASPVAAPQLLAFPYAQQVGKHRVYSEAPIRPELGGIVARADQLADRSPIAEPQAHQPIFLTSGGWRWTCLSLMTRSAFAVSRPIVETIVVNRSDEAADKVFNRRTIGGERSLSGTLAHEMTHGAIRAHFGVTADNQYPIWVREGYCDHIAGGGSLSDAEAQHLLKSDPKHPALAYWAGRKRVEAELRRNGGSVDALFAKAS